MLVAAAFVPTPPLLVPEIAGGSAAADEELRQACRAVVARLLDADVDHLVIVGQAPEDGPLDGSWDWRRFGVEAPASAPARSLPLGPAIGDWLLATAGRPIPAVRHHGVTAALPAQACAARGRELAGTRDRVALLVCGDGSACRSEKAPGSLDPSAAAWDDAALAALRDADAAALLRLDPMEGARLMAAGRAPWQVLAGAAGPGAFEAAIDWADAPYGVMYVVGTWLRKESA